MSRPKSPDDPVRFPIPCVRCNEHRAQAARWPDGYICQNCYRKAIRTIGKCVACAHRGVLPGVTDSGATCRRCSGISINVDCRACGNEDELYSAGICWSCTLARLVDETLADPVSGRVSPALEPLADGLKQMKRSNSGVTWIRQAHVQTFLRSLASADTVDHEALDAIPSSPTKTYVRALLVEHGVIPPRDEYLAVYLEWVANKLSHVQSRQHRSHVRQYVQWHQQRRLTRDGPATLGQFLRAKQETTVAIEFLNWLQAQETELAQVDEDTYLRWVSGGTSTRRLAQRFLRWAMQSNLAPTWNETYRPGNRKAPRMHREEQNELTGLVTRSTDLSARDRAVGILTLVFAQGIESITMLTRQDVTITAHEVTILLGEFPISLPPPLDEPFRELMADPDHQLTAAHPNLKWLFPGQKPGRPISASYLANRMKRLFQSRAARLGTLAELGKLGPSPIIAEALGYHVQTIEKHRIDSGDNYARYVGAVIESASRNQAGERG